MSSKVASSDRMNEEGYHNVYEDLSDEEKKKIKRFKTSLSYGEYTPSELLLAEFGTYYGWEALKDAGTGRLTARAFFGLLEAGRKVERTRRLESLDDMTIAFRSILDKKATSKLNELRKKLMK